MDERVFMSLGLLKVAAVMKSFMTVDVLDLSGIANYKNTVDDYLSGNKDVMIGITVTTPQLPNVVEIIKTIRNRNKDIKIVLGGPHVTLTHAGYLSEEKDGRKNGRAHKAFSDLEKLADVLIAGDGEKAILETLKPNVPKLIDADNPKNKLFLQVHGPINELDSTPWPDRNLVDVSSYHYTIDGVRALSIVTQLGCPFGCGFCGGRNSPSFRRRRNRSIPSIISEMEYLYKTYETRGFMFYDDELNVDHKFIVDLMTAIIDLQKRLGTEFRLRGFVKSQLFNQEQADLMYKAGFRWLLTGFESASPKILINMEKRATVEENTRCVEIGKKAGLKVKALMSIGHPGETKETILETKNWLLKVKPDDFDITIITVYPGTPYYDESREHETLKDVWVYTHKNGDKLYSKAINYTETADFYKGDPNGGYESYVFTPDLTAEEIVIERNNAEKEVREKLGIPYPSSAPAVKYEHSMGQSGLSVLRSSPKI